MPPSPRGHQRGALSRRKLGTEPPTRRRRGAGNPFDKEVAAGLIAKLEDAFILLPIFRPLNIARVHEVEEQTDIRGVRVDWNCWLILFAFGRSGDMGV